MPLDFPSSPTNGQSYAGYVYDSSLPGWRNVNSDFGVQSLNTMGLKNVVPSSVSVGSGSATVNANGTVTFSGASNVILNNIFTSTYSDYRIIFKATGSQNGSGCYIRFRSGATERTTNYYYGGAGYRESSAVIAWYATNVAQFDMTRLHANTVHYVADIFNPAISSSQTNISYNFWAIDNSGGFGASVSGGYSLANSNDGLILFTGGGTMTGTVQILGYTN